MEVTFHRPRCLLPAPSGSRTGRVGGAGRGEKRLGVVSGMSASPKTRREDDKRITVDIFPTAEGYMCDVAARCYIRRPAHVPENHSRLPSIFRRPFVLLSS